MERARDEALRARRQRFVEGVIETFPVLPFGLAEARVHARLWALLTSRGRLIGPHDLLVAATCLLSDHAVVTLNVKEFKRVPGLTVARVASFVRS